MKIAGITALIALPLALGGCGEFCPSDSGPTTLSTNAGFEQGAEQSSTTQYSNMGRIGTPYATSRTGTTAYVVSKIAGDSRMKSLPNE